MRLAALCFFFINFMAMKRVLAIFLSLALLAFSTQPAGAQKEHRALIVPLNFTDIHPGVSQETLDSLATELANYYNAQFNGKVSFHFDVAPTFNVGGKSTYYGANTSYQRDAQAYKMALNTYRTLYDKMDFSIYDNDNDGYVNDIIFLTPGIPESSGGGEDQFWPQYTELEDKDIPYSLRVRLYGYALVSEQNEDGSTAGIGLIAHEFGHILGLKDMYDTDAEASGGVCPGLGITCLMDNGMKNDSGNTPPNLNAVERDLLGTGKCEVIDSAGVFTLEPIHLNGRYFKLPTTTQESYYLLENRSSEGNDAFIGGHGMLIYKVDRSESDAGYSSYFQRTLTALERWNLNQVNCNPDFPCAAIVPAKIDTLDSSAIFWPKEGRSFSPGKMVLTNICAESDGSISFTALEPLRIGNVSVFQSSAIVNWAISEEMGPVDSCKIDWSRSGEPLGSEDGNHLGNGKYSFTIQGLKPRNTYVYTLRVHYSDGSSFSSSGKFITRIIRNGILRFMFFGETARNADGSFPVGASIPLVVYNSVDEEVVWSFNGRHIAPGPDGLWAIPGDGILKAEITTTNGTNDIIIKEIRVK